MSMGFDTLEAAWYSMMSFAMACVVVVNCVVIVALSSMRREKNNNFWALTVFAACVGFWNFAYALFYMWPDVNTLPQIDRLIYPAIGATSVSYFLFCYLYTFSVSEASAKKLCLLYIVPCITMLFAVVPPLGSLLMGYSGKILPLPLRELELVFGPWFFVHMAYSYALVIAGAVCLCIRCFSKYNERRLSAVAVLSISLIFIACNAFTTLTQNFSFAYNWITICTHALIINVFFITLYFSESDHIVLSGQRNMLDMMPVPVFVLNDVGRILYENLSASEFITDEIRKNEVIMMSDILETFTITKKELPDSVDGKEITILQQSGRTFFMNEIKIYDTKTHKENGKLVLFVTQAAFSTFFNDLETKAFHDELCGCFNRNYFEIKKSDFSSPEILPLSIILCDVDGLKAINDSYGHNTGDEYLVSCAETFRSCIRTTDILFRLGGDEFAALLPRAEERIAKEIKQKIEHEMQQRNMNSKYNMSMSVGSVTVNSLPVDIAACLKSADDDMYVQKKMRYGQRDDTSF